MLNVFISGLERQSGKTIVTAGLAATMQSLSYSTSVYKPIQTGATELNGFKSSPDLALIKRVDSNITTGSTYLIKSTSSPFVGAYEDGLKVDINTIFTEAQGYAKLHDCNIVEGSNSLAAPVAEHITEVDIIKTLNLPLILIVNPKKTSIDNVIMGLTLVQASRVKFLGIILTQYDENSEDLEEKYFPQILKEYANINILGILPNYGNIANLTPDTLIADILNKVKIEEIFGLEIAKLRG